MNFVSLACIIAVLMPILVNRLTRVDIRYEAKLSGASADQVRPELQRYRSCRLIVRYGEDAIFFSVTVEGCSQAQGAISKPNRLKSSKLGPRPLCRESERAKPSGIWHWDRLPSGIHFEVPSHGSNRGIAAVVQDHQTTRSHQFTQVEQVNKDLMKYITAIDKSGVREKVLAQRRGRAVWDCSWISEQTPARSASAMALHPALLKRS